MKSKEQLLREIKGELRYSQGDKVKVKGNVYTTPFDKELVKLTGVIDAVIFDLIVPGFCPYEITIGEEHYFCHENAIVVEEEE